MKPILIDIPPGELLDRITILRLKLRHQKDFNKQAKHRAELDLLRRARRAIPSLAELRAAVSALAAVNRRLWRIEDELRLCEGRRDFGASFIRLARSVYQLNDQRAEIRMKINRTVGSTATEQKIYKRDDRLPAARHSTRVTNPMKTAG